MTNLGSEPLIRFSFFIGVLLTMVAWEFFWPRRSLRQSRKSRWFSNLGLLVSYTVILRIFFASSAVGFAVLVQGQSWGFFNTLDIPWFFIFIFSVLILDLSIYAQHVAFHKVPVLWRLHRVHHTDLDLDVTTGLRFHPVEIFISLLIKFLMIFLIGADPFAVLVFEVALNATSMFNHSNIYIPLRVDHFLRYLLVTPDMHRVHHSIYREETDSNFGFNFPWWDRIFGTYTSQPKAGHLNMDLGVERFKDIRDLSFVKLLIQPFK